MQNINGYATFNMLTLYKKMQQNFGLKIFCSNELHIDQVTQLKG